VDFGIAVAKEAVIGVDDHEAVFGLVHHRIGTFGWDDDVFNAIAVQISHQRLKSDQGASRPELLLDEVIVDHRLDRGKNWRRLCGQRAG
jgi:hypothetical protein